MFNKMTAGRATWIGLHAVQHGLAIAGLNGVQNMVTCRGVPEQPGARRWGLTPCVPMSDAQFGIVVAVFTLGGLVASLGTRAVMARVGIVGTLRLSATAVTVGSAVLACGNVVWVMICARLVVGLGCGFSTATVPLALTAVAPARMKRALGIMNQLAIVLGILASLLLAFPFGHPYLWRWVPAVSVGMGMVQLVWSRFVVSIELDKDGEDDDGGVGEETPLLPSDGPLTITELFTSTDPKVKNALPIVFITQIFQQLSGASAVMYFTTAILSPVFTSSAKLVSLLVVLSKVPSTILPAFLIERCGTRALLVGPTAAVAVSHVLLAAGINYHLPALAAVGMMSFVTWFSIGIGPVTWVVLGTVLPPNARAAASSVALGLNWSLNFVVGATFLPLQALLRHDGEGDGSVFYVFAATCAVGTLAICEGYRRLDAGRAVAS